MACYFVVVDTCLLSQTLYFQYALRPEDEPLLADQESVYSSVMFVALLQLKNAVNHDSFSFKVGSIIAWVCTALYLSSRIPQIYLNYKRKSVQGLAMGNLILRGMFTFALLGNLTYAFSILAKSREAVYLQNALPYLLGSAGTVAFDIVIFSQYLVYKNVDE